MVKYQIDERQTRDAVGEALKSDRFVRFFPHIITKWYETHVITFSDLPRALPISRDDWTEHDHHRAMVERTHAVVTVGDDASFSCVVERVTADHVVVLLGR